MENVKTMPHRFLKAARPERSRQAARRTSQASAACQSESHQNPESIERSGT